jgi:hypothetical protein
MTDRAGRWRRSSRCESHNCVEVALVRGGVLVRDSGAPDGPVVEVDGAAWRAFCTGLRAGLA